MPTVHTFYLGHDNDQAFELAEDGANLDVGQYNGIERIVLQLDRGPTLDSENHEQLLKWGEHHGNVGARVVIEGRQLVAAGVEPGRYGVRVVAYSDDQPTGVVFVDYMDYVWVVHAGAPPGEGAS